MSLPNHLGAYGPELDYFEKALEDPKGIRIHYESVEVARNATFRFHQARSLHREQTKKVYPDKADFRHGNSPFDVLICKLREDTEGDWWVYIERHGIKAERVESLSELEP